MFLLREYFKQEIGVGIGITDVVAMTADVETVVDFNKED